MFLMDWDEMSNLYEGPFHKCFLPSFISFGWGVSEERIKMWKVNDDGRQTTDAKWWQKFTLPLARWAKKIEIHVYIYYKCIFFYSNAFICNSIHISIKITAFWIQIFIFKQELSFF
jgi:hypothetical protein